MTRNRIVDLTWPPERIKQFCENTDNWTLMLDPAMTPSDVEALYRRQLTVAEPYAGLIGEIAADRRTPLWVLKDIATRFSEDEILGGLATNPAVPDAILARLEQHEHPHVREHAEQTRRAARDGRLKRPQKASVTVPHAKDGQGQKQRRVARKSSARRR
jgi:hypothetical protein